MHNFTYQRPTTVADAVKALGGASDGKIIAGGMTLVPTLKQRLAALRMSWRRKSAVMRRLDMGRVSNHSPWRSQGNILQCTRVKRTRGAPRFPRRVSTMGRLRAAESRASRGCG